MCIGTHRVLSLEVCGQIRVPQTVVETWKASFPVPPHSLEAIPYHSFKVEKEQQLAVQVLQAHLGWPVALFCFTLEDLRQQEV